MGQRTFWGQLQYYALFVGSDASENVWLAEEYLPNAKDLFSEYQLVYGL